MSRLVTNIYIKDKVAVVSAGMTKFTRRAVESTKELAWEAVNRALEDANMEIRDIECIVSGSAPDAFDGIHMKGESYSSSIGGSYKPHVRVYTGGGTGVMVPVAGWWHVASGLCDTVLLVAEEKMSPAQPHPQYVFKHIWDPITEKPLEPNLIWIFALEMRRYMYKYNVKKEDIALVSVKNKKNALDHPSAQVAEKITVEDVLNSEVLVWPVNRLDVSPVSDGTVALILAREKVAKTITDTPVWLEGIGFTLEDSMWINRELAYPLYVEAAARMAYKMAGIERPWKEIDFAEPYDPFDYKELQHAEALMLFNKGEAYKATKEGITERDGDLPLSPSGGLLGVGNPIAAAGLMKVAELYYQLSGRAGKRQVKKPVHTGVSQAWGDLLEAGTVVVMKN